MEKPLIGNRKIARVFSPVRLTFHRELSERDTSPGIGECNRLFFEILGRILWHRQDDSLHTMTPDSWNLMNCFWTTFSLRAFQKRNMLFWLQTNRIRLDKYCRNERAAFQRRLTGWPTGKREELEKTSDEWRVSPHTTITQPIQMVEMFFRFINVSLTLLRSAAVSVSGYVFYLPFLSENRRKIVLAKGSSIESMPQ